MKNKKGFVFVETIIVTCVLTASLLVLYSSYSASIRNEKARLKYNDSIYLYRTYYLEKFFRNFRLDLAAVSLNKDPSKPIFILSNFGCRNDIFINEADNLGFCESLFGELHISNLYLTFNDLSELQNCTNQSGICETLLQVNSTMADYLKTIGGKGKYGYRVIVEFAETKDGKKCENDAEDCVYYYSTLSLGEI